MSAAPDPWQSTLSASIHALKTAARDARDAYQRVARDHDQAQEDALRADLPGEALRQPSAERYMPYADVLGRIAFSHQGLRTSISRTWFSTARTYAWGTSHALAALRDGRTPRFATTPASTRVALPTLTLTGPPVHTLSTAHATEASIHIQVREFAASDWSEAAEAWHTHADAVHALLLPLIVEHGVAATSTTEGGQA
ncbi:hypothetical protein GCM10009801_73060 [Streptomyces albiaxialis]|uniref:Uncharacterized protein n=1 Tax=Streptomyces albiaxialis TaxID=329523 RepID=A0ABP5ILA0_9ACTN